MSSQSAGEDAPTKGARNEMRMITRAVAVLRALADQPGGLSFGQIAKATGLARATVQRLVGALESERLVSTHAGVVGVRLGVELARLGAAVHAEARRLFRPHLEDLHARVEETIDLTKLVGGEAIMIEQIASPRALRVVSQVGQALPLHCTASGKAHLTQMSLAEAERELPRVLKQFTPATSADRESLLSLAGTANERRCQLDVEECFEGVCALGLPIRGIAADNYAIAVSMPSQRFGERLDFLSRELIKCQDAIERAIGAS